MKQCEHHELAMSCYVDGELNATERSDLFGHLTMCDRCSAFFCRLIELRIAAAKQIRATIPDQPALGLSSIRRYGRQPEMRLRSSTIALALLSLLVCGLLFSATVEIQTTIEDRPTTTILP
jgi:anti-sigma factor RsiW